MEDYSGMGRPGKNIQQFQSRGLQILSRHVRQSDLLASEPREPVMEGLSISYLESTLFGVALVHQGKANLFRS